MVSAFGWFYFGAGTLLFFFWVYGIYAFVRDSRRRYVPGLRRWIASRRERTEEERDRDEDREEREQQLY